MKSSDPPGTNNSRLKFALRALRHRNYRLFFAGQSLSMVGNWITQVATSWLVYRLTNSPFLLGLVGFSGQIPALVLTPFAGVWVDRWNRHRVLKVTQFLSMLESFALAALALTNHINIWHIVGLTMFQGVVNAIDMPARQTFVVEMIEDRTDLPSAIALNSTMVNGARLVGPSIAGIIIAVAGEGYCFLIDGFSYLAVIASLFLMRMPSSPRQVRQDVLSGLKEGWSYITGSVPLRSILGLIAFVSLTGFPYSVLLPVFASSILQGGPDTLGFLTGAAGVGALASALTLAMRKTIVGLGKVINVMVFVFGAGLILFGFSRTAWLSILLMVPVGFSMMGMLAASNTIMQTIVEEDKRGRVMSFYTLSFAGLMPLGSLIAGLLASRIGAPMTVAGGGALCILAGLWLASHLPEIRRIIRPIYVELGILPEVANGLQAASALQTPPEIVD
jgi:MFS family permease